MVQREREKTRETFAILFLSEGSDEHGESIDEKNDLRISQPKYSQLLRELDFGEARMVNKSFFLLFDRDN